MWERVHNRLDDLVGRRRLQRGDLSLEGIPCVRIDLAICSSSLRRDLNRLVKVCGDFWGSLQAREPCFWCIIDKLRCICPLVSRGVHWLARRVWPRLGVCFAQEHLAVVGSLSFAIAVVRACVSHSRSFGVCVSLSQSFGAHGLCALLRAEAGECGHRWHRGRTWRDARAERAPRSVGRAGSR